MCPLRACFWNVCLFLECMPVFGVCVCLWSVCLSLECVFVFGVFACLWSVQSGIVAPAAALIHPTPSPVLHTGSSVPGDTGWSRKPRETPRSPFSHNPFTDLHDITTKQRLTAAGRFSLTYTMNSLTRIEILKIVINEPVDEGRRVE